MKTLRRLILLLLITCVFFGLVTKTNASPARYLDVSKRADTSVNDHPTVTVDTPTPQQVPTPMAAPNWTSMVQHRESGVIKAYSREWWMTVYGSVNGIQKHMIVLGTFLILIGLFLCTMGYRQWQPALAVMGILTFGLFTWIALANCRPDRGYPNDTIVMIVVPVCIGLIGAGIYFVFFSVGFYLAGALGGLAFAIYICSWKYNLLIEHWIGRPSFLAGMAIVFAVGTYFVLRHFLMFATSFVGAYITFLGIDVLARKGYIAGFERILNGNANSRVEYAVSNIVYVFLGMTLLLFFASFGFQFWFNRQFEIVLVPPQSEEQPKPEPAKQEGGQGEGGEGGEGGGDGGSTGSGGSDGGGGDGDEQASPENAKSNAPSVAPTQTAQSGPPPSTSPAPSAAPSAAPTAAPTTAPPPPPPGTATTIHTTSARFTIGPD